MRRLVAATLAILLAGPGLAAAQPYPTRPVSIVVPYAPGGPTDALAREIAAHLRPALGQPVIVENAAGGNGNIGTARVARAVPDGHILLLNNLAITTNVGLYPGIAPDPAATLVPVGLVNSNALVLVGRNTLPARTVPELIAWMRTNRAMFAGSTGPIYTALFAATIGAPIEFIPYRGGALALQDVVAGHADLYLGTTQVLLSAIQANLVRGFGITARERSPLLPQLPSLVDDLGPGIEIVFWHCLFAPAGTPTPILDRLNAALQDLIADPKVLEGWAANGYSPFAPARRSPGAARDFVRDEVARWSAVIRDNGITAPN